MAKPVRRGVDAVDLVPQERQAWQMQIWMLLVLVVGILAMGIAVYSFVKRNGFRWTPEDVLGLVPPLMFAVVAVFLLAAFYMAQREAVVHALREELLTQKIEAELNRELTLLDPVTEVYNRR